MHRAVCVLGVVAFAILAGGGSGLGAQVELDRVVSRVAGRAITTLDIRQARSMRLVSDVSSDGAVQRQLENRLLAMAEVSRAVASVNVADSAVASRRADWERDVGGAEAARRLMTEHEMTDADLAAWFRDDLRVAQLIDRQFSGLPPADRSRATGDWYQRLRQRADLR